MKLKKKKYRKSIVNGQHFNLSHNLKNMFNSNFRKLSQTVHKNISKQISFKHVSITCTILMLQKMS
jgi:hypothetical protein